MEIDLKAHWENVYATKQPDQVSWTQEVPVTSLELIDLLKLPESVRIIDVGGGDSKLVDHLLMRGYSDITVLDISAKSIERAKLRLGKLADKVTWIESDVLSFRPAVKYDIWHDRAAFHFLTDPAAIRTYMQIVSQSAKHPIIGTFSVDGPFKCSGLEIRQYDEATMRNLFEEAGFVSNECRRVNHTTPSGSVQNFLFCSFSKK